MTSVWCLFHSRFFLMAHIWVMWNTVSLSDILVLVKIKKTLKLCFDIPMSTCAIKGAQNQNVFCSFGLTAHEK